MVTMEQSGRYLMVSFLPPWGAGVPSRNATDKFHHPKRIVKDLNELVTGLCK